MIEYIDVLNDKGKQVIIMRYFARSLADMKLSFSIVNVVNDDAFFYHVAFPMIAAIHAFSIANLCHGDIIKVVKSFNIVKSS